MQKYSPVSVVVTVSLHLDDYSSCVLTSSADNESIPTIRCSTCSEWHHRPCVSISEKDDLSFVCQRCKDMRKKQLGEEHSDSSFRGNVLLLQNSNVSYLTMVLGETKAYYSEDKSAETLRAETSGPLTSSPIPVITWGFKWPSFFRRERQANVKQSDIVIVCVFPMYYRIYTLIPTTSALLDQLE